MGLLVDDQSTIEQRSRLFRLPELLRHHRQICESGRYLPMMGTMRLFRDGERALEQRPRLFRLPQLPQHHRQVRKDCGHVRMVIAVDVLVDGERAYEQRPCLLWLTGALQHSCQVRFADMLRTLKGESLREEISKHPGASSLPQNLLDSLIFAATATG